MDSLEVVKVYDIWSEGYSSSDGRGRAYYHGKSKGISFKDAVNNFANTNKSFKESFNSERMTYYGCRLFDNEKDAREIFG